MSLFDLDPIPEPVQLSATRRLTLRNQAQLDRNVHPATLAQLAGNGETCGTCAHHQDLSWRSNNHLHKCALHRLGVTHSAASDIRVSWPACTRWEPEA